MVVVNPGELSHEHSIAGIVTPATITAGQTFSFDITGYDAYQSLAETGSEDDVQVVARITERTIPIVCNSMTGATDLGTWETLASNNVAGTVHGTLPNLQGHLTIFEPGEFEIDVFINNNHITDSPFSILTVIPAEIYPPNCLISSVPLLATAGIETEILVTGRDYYGNSIDSLITSVSATTIEVISIDDPTVIYTGTITDVVGQVGIYKVAYTHSGPSGSYDLHIKIESLPVAGSPYRLIVESGSTTDPTETTLVPPFRELYTFGEPIEFTIEARDQYGNIRTSSTSELFAVTLIDAGTNSISGTVTSNGDGTYDAIIQTSGLTALPEPSSNTYTIRVETVEATPQLVGTGNTEITKEGNVQAKVSKFVTPATTVTAGTHTYSISARDQYDNEITQEVPFPFYITQDSPGQDIQLIPADFSFGLYEADLQLNTAGDHDLQIVLTRSLGLKATYFTTSAFISPVVGGQ
jgi:hypothetical protein